MQKKNLFLSLLVLGMLIAVPLVLAQYSITQDILNPIKSFFSTFIKALFIADFNEPALYSRVLLFLIVFLIVENIVSKTIMAGSKLSWLLSIVVAILGIRILPAKIIDLVMLPYGTLAVVVTSLVPLIILWYFTYTIPTKGLRTFAWWVAGLSFIVLAALRYNVIGKSIGIYAVAAIASFVIPFIQGYLKSKEIEKAGEQMGSTNIRAKIARIEQQLDALIEGKAAALAVNNTGLSARLQRDIDRLTRERTEFERALGTKKAE